MIVYHPVYNLLLRHEPPTLFCFCDQVSADRVSRATVVPSRIETRMRYAPSKFKTIRSRLKRTEEVGLKRSV